MSSSVKRAIFIIILVVIAAVIIIPKTGLINGNITIPASDVTNLTAPSKTPVGAVIAVAKDLSNTISVSGTILPNESVELRVESSGIVSKLYFKEGQNVKKGELLLTLDDEELQAQLQKVKSNKKLYADNEFRQRQLLKKEAISQEEYDRALNELNTILADLRLIEAQIADTKIMAPFDGTLGLRQISEGAYLTPASLITQLYNIDPVKIEFAIPGKFSNIIKVGSEVSYTVDASDKIFQGEVYAIEPQIDPTTRTLKIRAISPNNAGEVRPGQFAKIELVLGEKANALLVPSGAVVPILNGNVVYVARGGQAEEINVKTGLRTDREIEILDGLIPGDTVIVSGLLQIRKGSLVTVSINN